MLYGFELKYYQGNLQQSKWVLNIVHLNLIEIIWENNLNSDRLVKGSSDKVMLMKREGHKKNIIQIS